MVLILILWIYWLPPYLIKFYNEIFSFINANFLFNIIFAFSVIWYTTVADYQIFSQIRNQLE